MNLLQNKLYLEDLIYVANLDLPWNKLNEKTFIISGASGMLSSFLIDVLMFRNQNYNLKCKVIALGRNYEKAYERFSKYWENNQFSFKKQDINRTISFNDVESADYIFHAASNTHPVAYATDPVGTIMTNILGTYNLLEFAKNHNTTRFAFASSNEIYGENKGDVEFFNEDFCGYINSNTLRAGYPESKRAGEALCQAFIHKNNMDIVIPRFTRTYGPTMLQTDTKAISQFIHKGLNNENIILKSAGKQFYSYTYVTDAIAGFFIVLLKGDSGEAYNIADSSTDITLKELAELIAQLSNTKVVFDLPDAVEKLGYSTATKARLSGEKIKNLGWKSKYSLTEGLSRTLKILQTN